MYRNLRVTPTDILGNPTGVTSGALHNTLVEESISTPGSYVGIKATTEGALVTSLIDHYGVQQYLAPNGEIVALPLFKLVGDSFALAALDTGMWLPTLTAGGTAVVTGGELVLSTNTTANGSVIIESLAVARFTGLGPNKLRIVVQLPDTGVVNNTREWGIDNLARTNGAFFRLADTTFSIVTRKNSVDTVVTNGNFNGQYGPTFNPGTTSHFYEIIYQPRQVVFLADNKIIHTITASTATWTETLHLHIHYENTNINGSTTNVVMKSRLGTIARFGISEAQREGFFQQGLTAGTTLKIGPGDLHSIILSAITNNANITLYDSITAAGTVLFSTGTMPPNTIPLMLDLGGINFNNGLTLAITGAAANALIVFD